MDYLSYEEIEKLRDNLTDEEYLELLYYNFPSIWIEDFLPDPTDFVNKVKLRHYQLAIANNHSTKKVLRLGRQMGKSALICMLIIYYGLKRKGSKILVIGPQKTHVEEIFDHVNEIASHNVEISSKMETKRQPMQIIFKGDGFKNKAMFLTTGEENGGKALSVRGKTSNVLFVDEADYINDATMEQVVIPTTNSFADPIIYLSSTPTGRKGFFRNAWDSGFYKTFHFKSCESPTWNENKELQIRAGTTKATYLREYEAEFTDTESGVFSKDDMKACTDKSFIHIKSESIQEGINRQYTSLDTIEMMNNIIKPKCRILGVDWNKSENGTRLVWVDFDQDNNMWFRQKWKIDAMEFTQNVAIQKIIELNTNLNFDYIMVDIGYGTVQIEDLHLHGLQNPRTKLDKIVKGVPTDSQMDITDIATGETRKTFVKNFIVESTVRFMEQHRIRVPEEENMKIGRKPKDKSASIFDQMNDYVIDKITANGRPIYKGGSDDHDLDAFMFTLYGYLTQVIKTQKLWDKLPVAKPKVLSYDKIIAKRNDNDSKDGEVEIKQEPGLFAKYQNSVYADSGFIHRRLSTSNHKRFGSSGKKIIGRSIR